MLPIIPYLKDQVIPNNKEEVDKLRRRSAHFVFVDNMLYNRDFSSSLLRCVGGKKAMYILRGGHEGFCGNHSGYLALAQKVRRNGYYWPTLKKKALGFVRVHEIMISI